MKTPWRRLALIALGLTLLSGLMPPMQGIADGTTGATYLYAFGWPLAWLEGGLPHALPEAAAPGGLVALAQSPAHWRVDLLGGGGTWLVALALSVLGWRLWRAWRDR